MAFDPEVQAALVRLQTYFNGNNYDPQANPGGLRNGGHRINFPLSLVDVGKVVAAIGDLQAQIGSGQIAADALRDVLNRVGRRKIDDQNVSISSSDYYVSFRTLTAGRAVTLPPASSYAAFPPLYIADESGQCSFDAPITVLPAGSDTIAGATSQQLIGPYQKVVLHSNGTNLWTFA